MFKTTFGLQQEIRSKIEKPETVQGCQSSVS
jgi:hypothetical protein